MNITKVFLSAAPPSLIFACALNATLFTADDVNLWKVATGQTDMTFKTFWSTSPTETLNPTVLDLPNSVISVATTGSVTTPCYVPAGATTVKGIYLSESLRFGMYNNAADSTFTVTEGITLEDPSVTFTIRRKNGANNFGVTIGDINVINQSAGSLSLGTGSEGQWLNSLTLTGDLKVSGTSAYQAKLDVYTAAFTMQKENAVIELDNTYWYFRKSGNLGTDAASFATPDVDLSKTTINLSGSSTIQYGTGYNNRSDGKVDFGDVNLKSADINSELVVYTNGVSSENPTTVGNITSTVDGDAGSFFGLRFNFSAANVGDVNLSVEKFNFFAIGNIRSYANNYKHGDSHFNIGSAGYVYINSALVNNGSLVLGGTDMAAFNTGNKNYYVDGLEGTGSRITTSYNSSTGNTGNTGTATLILRGSGNYSTSNALIDMALGADAATLGKTGALALDVRLTGSGVQYIRTSSYYRGDTTIASGRLYLNADGSTRFYTGDWGIGSVKLNGGYLGAIGATTDYGTLIATDITFAGGALAFDISNASHDVVKLLSDTPISAASDDLIAFEFNITDITLDTEYKIMEWDSSVDMSMFDPDNFTATIIGADDLEAAFSFAADGTGLNVSFYQIPEPSQVAALIGLLALFMALRRRKK